MELDHLFRCHLNGEVFVVHAPMRPELEFIIGLNNTLDSFTAPLVQAMIDSVQDLDGHLIPGKGLSTQRIRSQDHILDRAATHEQSQVQHS